MPDNSYKLTIEDFRLGDAIATPAGQLGIIDSFKIQARVNGGYLIFSIDDIRNYDAERRHAEAQAAKRPSHIKIIDPKGLTWWTLGAVYPVKSWRGKLPRVVCDDGDLTTVDMATWEAAPAPVADSAQVSPVEQEPLTWPSMYDAQGNLCHVVEKRAYDAMKAERDALKIELAESRRVNGILSDQLTDKPAAPKVESLKEYAIRWYLAGLCYGDNFASSAMDEFESKFKADSAAKVQK